MCDDLTLRSISGTELLAAVLGPQCGATIWVKNTGIFGTSVNNGIGNCIQAKLVDQEGGGAVGELLLPQATMTVAASFPRAYANNIEQT